MHRLPRLGSLASCFALRPGSRLFQFSCRYSTVVPQSRSRTVRIPVGGSGHVELHIKKPLYPSSESTPSVLVYIPSSNAVLLPQKSPGLHNVNDASFLSSQLPSTTLITLKYRLENLPSPLAYPIAIHDTATAFDYIRTTLLASSRCKPKICLYGSHIGGSLAIMLALTQPNDIQAIAVSEPMVDWVCLEDYTAKQVPPGVQKSKKTPISESEIQAAKHLMEIRSGLFRTPALYFDSFASPTLFLRAPGRDTPATHIAYGIPDMLDHDDYLPPEAFGPYDDELHPSSPASRPPSSAASALSDTDLDSDSPNRKEPKRRKVLSRWPTNGRPESALLPHTRIFVHPRLTKQPSTIEQGTHSILRAQGVEMAELMRRACFFGREKGLAEERVNVTEANGDGTGSLGLEEAARWLREKCEDGQ